MITALVVGTLLAVAALAFVLYPVFFGVSSARTPGPQPRQTQREAAVAALREIEFDGKRSAVAGLERRLHRAQIALYGGSGARDASRDRRGAGRSAFDR